MGEQYLKVDGVMRLFDVSESTVRRWLREGKVPGQKVGGQWRFKRTDVLEAYERGLLSGAANPGNSGRPAGQHGQWGGSVGRELARWRRDLGHAIGTFRPDHVVVNDRRGAKTWQKMDVSEYVWGKNLWHSNSVHHMDRAERCRLFNHTRVLLFDEMMQHGRAMHDLRSMLESIGAEVESFVCICSRTHLEVGETLEPKAHMCEILGDKDFGRRAAMISRLMASSPPLDADHLVIHGTMAPYESVDSMVETLSHWGVVFVVAHPDPDHQFLAVTLDRPQFFSPPNLDVDGGLQMLWDGPCKIRFYINTADNHGSFVFIAYPRIVGSTTAWLTRFPELSDRLIHVDHSWSPSIGVSRAAIGRVYEDLCIDCAIKLLEDFKTSGAAVDVGANLVNTPTALDGNELCATFGPTRGARIEQRVRRVLSHKRAGKCLPHEFPKSAPSLIVRPGATTARSQDVSACRDDFLDIIPTWSAPLSSGEHGKPSTPTRTILQELDRYSEVAVGKVLDFEIDRGTIKPSLYVDLHRDEFETGQKTLEVGRGFYRGEFQPPYVARTGSFHTYDDLERRHTSVICAHVLQEFLRRIGRSTLSAELFAAIFANLSLDWPKERSLGLYYFLELKSHIPVALVPEIDSLGNHRRLEGFLVQKGCIEAVSDPMGQRGFRTRESSEYPWHEIYRQEIVGDIRADVEGFIRLYVTLHNECRKGATRHGASHSSSPEDVLMALASARSQKVAYQSGLFELEDWLQKGQDMFALLTRSAHTEEPIDAPGLVNLMRQLAEPSRNLLYKIETYRNIASLRSQIEELAHAHDCEMAYVLLDNMDERPRIEADHDYPIANLEWVHSIMDPLTSFLAQVLSILDPACDHLSTTEDSTGTDRLREAFRRLELLAERLPELEPLLDDLEDCIRQVGQCRLTAAVTRPLSRAVEFVTVLLSDPNRIPRYAGQSGDSVWVYRSALFDACLQDITLREPYVIAVIDVGGFMALARCLSVLHGDGVDGGAAGPRRQLDRCVEAVVETALDVRYSGRTADAIILAGPDADSVLGCILDLMERTTQIVGQEHSGPSSFGLLKAGIALHDRGRGRGFQGIAPGRIARRIASEQMRVPGGIAVTNPIWKSLSPSHQRHFVVAEGKQCAQEQVYVCCEDRSIDEESSVKTVNLGQ